jgi:DNA-binding transcriptional MerR regulator
LLVDSNTVIEEYTVMQNATLEELVRAVNAWADEHGVRPASGQAADALSVRNARFYRTSGLLDAPDTVDGAGYGEKHRLQLVAVRLLQAQGLPLRRIRELLVGRTIAELGEVERRGLADLRSLEAGSLPGEAPKRRGATPESTETWKLHPVGPGLLLVATDGRRLPEAILAEIRELLAQRLS